MKKFVWILLILPIIAGCSNTKDKQQKLNRLLERRDKINTQIGELRSEIQQEQNYTGPVPTVSVQSIVPQSFVHKIRVQGAIESDHNILVPSEFSGVVKDIYVKEGDRVKKGQLLAKLDGAIIERNISEIKNNLELAQTIFERTERLWKKKIGSEVDYLQARNNKVSLEKKLETLQEQYQQTFIKAPINGQIDQVLLKEGEMVSAGKGAIRVVQISALKAVGEISESYIGQVKKGDLVEVRIPVLNRALKLPVHAVSQVINMDNRTFTIELRIPKTEKEIRPNMLVVLEVIDYKCDHSLVVPQKVLHLNGSKQFVFVAEKEGEKWKARKKPVQIGKSYRNKTEILNGLESGDALIILGYQNLSDDQNILLDQQSPITHQLAKK